MKNRLLAVGAAVILAVGIYLGNLFQGFGLGEGGSAESGGDVQVNLTAQNPASPPAASSPDPRPAEVASTDALTLVVQPDGYAVQQGSDETAGFTPSTLDAIVQKAAETRPDAHGVRVRLRYSQHAEIGAVDILSRRLKASAAEEGGGLLPEEIIEVSGHVD